MNDKYLHKYFNKTMLHKTVFIDKSATHEKLKLSVLLRILVPTFGTKEKPEPTKHFR